MKVFFRSAIEWSASLFGGKESLKWMMGVQGIRVPLMERGFGRRGVKTYANACQTIC